MASARFERMVSPGSRARRVLIALAIYIVCAATFAVVAGAQRLTVHTQFNHYALLADAWRHGRQDLAGGAPGYAQGNDFAVYPPQSPNEPPGTVHRTYISFPPFPAVLMLPFVAMSGGADEFRDGQFVIMWLAGLAPAFLFLVLEKLRRPNAQGETHSTRSELQNVLLALLFAFGTVYFFTAVEGTVWFAANVVGASLVALYALFALDAEQPLIAGVVLACAFATRPSTLLAGSLFALEAIRVHAREGLPVEGSFFGRVIETAKRLDKAKLARAYALFAAPLLLVFAIESWMNHLRFDTWNPNVGHEYLTVVWAGRMQKWGLFGYHYLAKNLGVALTVLPWLPPKGTDSIAGAPFKINEHGLALWFTTPFYLWCLWPKRASWRYSVVAIAALLPAILDLLYQNSGWRQFGYRFSNDYSPLLFILLATGGRSIGWFFRGAAVWSVGWNLFGAVTFDRREADRFYFRESTQEVLYQKD